MAPSDPAISVVVPTRDRRDRLLMLLGSLAGQSLDRDLFEVIVVDDGAGEGTAAALEAAASLPIEIRVVRGGPGGGGPAMARNHGWRAARAELIAFTDDDCEPSEQWLESGLETARAHPGAIVQGLTEPNPRELDRLGPFSRTISVPGPSAFFETCNIFYPRALLEDLGGFDERFPEAAGEDSDLGWRAVEQGAERVFDRRAAVHHAVEELGVLEFLGQALHGVDAAYGRRRHPGLRAADSYAWVFRRRSHARLALAVAGLGLARRFPPAALLALPYCKGLLGRSRARGAVWLVPFLAAYDVLEVFKAVRGSIRHRVLWL